MKSKKMLAVVFMGLGMLATCLFPNKAKAASYAVPTPAQTVPAQDTPTAAQTNNTIVTTTENTLIDPATVTAENLAVNANNSITSGTTTSAPAWYNGFMTAYNVSWTTNLNGTNGLAFKLYYPSGVTFQFQKCTELTTGAWTSVKSAELLSPLPSLSTEVGNRFGPFVYNTATWIVNKSGFSDKAFFRTKSTNYPTNPVEIVSQPQMAKQ